MRSPAFYIFENKGLDQLCSNQATHQRLCFCHTDSTIHLLPKLQVSDQVRNPEDRFAHEMTYFILGMIHQKETDHSIQ